MGLYQVLPLQDRVNLGVMAMRGYTAFPKAPALLESYSQIVSWHIQDTRWWGSYPLGKGAAGVFYSPNRLGNSSSISSSNNERIEIRKRRKLDEVHEGKYNWSPFKRKVIKHGFDNGKRRFPILLRAIGQMSRVFANGPGDRGSIPGRVIPKTQNVLLDT